MGAISSVIGGLYQGEMYSAKKRMSLANGEAQKNAAYSMATASEQASKAQLQVEAENLSRMAGNKRRDMGAARNANAATGFTSAGSGQTGEGIVNKVHAQAMADAARSGSTASMNALDEQVATRRQGDAAMRAAEIEAQQYAAMAKMSRTGAFISAVGGVIGGVAGGIDGWGRAADFNEANSAAIKAGEVQAQNRWGSALWGAVNGSDAGGGLLASTNPFTAPLAGKGWDEKLLGMLGVGNINKK